MFLLKLGSKLQNLAENLQCAMKKLTKLQTAFPRSGMHNGAVGPDRIKNALCFQVFFWQYFVVFHHKIYVFIIFIHFFLMKYQISSTEH